MGQKVKFGSKSEIWIKNRNFGKNIEIWVKNEIFWQKLSEIGKFWLKRRFLTEISIFDPNLNFCPNFHF